MIWWFILYWPIAGIVVFAGHQFAQRYPKTLIARDRAAVVQGCLIILLLIVPIVVAPFFLVYYTLIFVFAN